MNRTVHTLLAAALGFSLASDALAEQEKENAPNKREAAEILTQLGEEHMPDKMKVNFVGSVEVGETYYHIYSGVKRKSGYRIIIFDNTPKYLGYYDSEFEAVDFAPGEFYLDSGNVNADGSPSYLTVPIDSRGPRKSISINGIPSDFVIAPKAESEETTAGEGGTEAAPAKQRMPIEFREWVITHKGETYHKRAKFVTKDGFKVILQSEESGREAPFILTQLSEADRAYVDQVTQ